MNMKKTLIAALVLLCAGMTVQADGLASLGAKAVELVGGKAPVLVLAPGTKLNISGQHGGKVVEVFGLDKCPRDFADQGPGRDGCTFLDKPSVTVRYVDEGKLVTEQWTVISKDTLTSLHRPNGAVVSRAQ